MTRSLFIFLFLLPSTVFAQSGQITYELVSQFEIPFQEDFENNPALEEMIEAFPNFNTNYFLLSFNSEASLMRMDQDYRDSLTVDANVKMNKLMEEDGEEVMAALMASMGHMMSSASEYMDEVMEEKDAIPFPVTGTYIDFTDDTYLQYRDVSTRELLVKGERELLSWRMTGEERTLLGYRIFQATALQDTIPLEAWFTPEIPIPLGPDLWGGLPGAILVLSVNSDESVYTAVKADLESDPEIIRPSGKEHTQEEFGAIAKEKIRELREQLKQIENMVPFQY